MGLSASGRPPSRTTPDTRYGLWEWVAALGGEDERAGGESFVTTVARVRSVISGLGDVLADYWPRIAPASPAVIAAMEAARARVQREWDARWAPARRAW
jgi:hypothetical protein